ncbi:MAG: zinc ribbon domain-containing protein [Sedimentisphaerales bacterium]|nr:zinc ribbon domain-containing protein [Sedimentisphaerales bacterium]
MPIFEYKCVKCGSISEFLEPHDSKQPRVCLDCGGRELVKQLSTFAFRVKEGESKRCKSCSDRSCPHSGY